ncbi:competence protein CoiA family protein [Clostridium sp.]|uniref:competence protein CoiA n=1 Tax=Clostridium sp. TaxID=1506 RepID=UPI0025BA4811|nr:competence protein CoiA family protein [Clostridium sp.]
MLVGIDSKGRKVYCNSYLDKKEIFTCPWCGGVLAYKNGLIKMPHFAHVKKSNCNYYIYAKRETEKSIEMKWNLKKWLLELDSIKEVEFERKLIPGVITDLVATNLKGQILACEVVSRRITLREFIERTKKYNNARILVLWIWSINLLREDPIKDGIKRIRKNSFFYKMSWKNGLYFMDELGNMYNRFIDYDPELKCIFEMNLIHPSEVRGFTSVWIKPANKFLRVANYV